MGAFINGIGFGGVLLILLEIDTIKHQSSIGIYFAPKWIAGSSALHEALAALQKNTHWIDEVLVQEFNFKLIAIVGTYSK